MTQRLLLVDGSNLLFQMFYGMPSRIVGKNGKAIQGTLGFVGALLKIIRLTQATHVAVLFDGEHENDRTALDASYKANRTDYSAIPEEESPFSQLPDIYAALDHLKIRHCETTDCEADDVIASYALTLGNEHKLVIASMDSDFFQLITEHISVLRYRGDHTQICTPTYVKEKFGILPNQYADFKALVGDPADNIKGAEKIGVKTAARLLNAFGTLDGILSASSSIKPDTVRTSLLKNAEKLITNCKIIKLNDSVPRPFSIAELRYTLDDDVSTNRVLRAIGILS